MGLPRKMLCVKPVIPSNNFKSVNFYKGIAQIGDNKNYTNNSYTLLKSNVKVIVKDNISFTTKATMIDRSQNTSVVAKEIILQNFTIDNIYQFLASNKRCLYVKLYQELYEVIEFTTLTSIKINGQTYNAVGDKPFYQLSLAFKQYDFQG
jgi:hypothetical protein